MNYSLFDSDHAFQSEKQRSLISDWVEEVNKNKWFQMFVPSELGGLGLGLPEALHLEEKIASWDGSLGWTVTLCSGAMWFTGFLDETLRDELFPNSNLCFAGSGYVGGKAEKKNGGFVISGSWTYASGALHASHFTANCEVWENGKVVEKDGVPLVRAFILKKEEVEILDGWNYMGMIATGSHAFRTESLKVSTNRIFDIEPHHATWDAPIFQFPFLQFAEATLTANILGISRHLQQLIVQSFEKRNQRKGFNSQELEYANRLFKRASKDLDKASEDFYISIDLAWEDLIQSGEIKKSLLNQISKKSRELVGVCRNTNMSVYPFAGLEAAKTNSELNRVWRDFATVSQHALITFPYFG